MSAVRPLFYRYRTSVLAGPWRSRPEQALEDAVAARQGRYEDGGLFVWLVAGSIEASGLIVPNTADEE